MAVDTYLAARDRLLAADRAAAPVDHVVREVLAALHELTPFGVGCALLTDPATLLPFGGVVEGFREDGCVPFWDNELLEPDFNKFNDVARSSDPVAVLSDVTDGDCTRSPRFRYQYEPLGCGDELRVAFRSGDSCWAVGVVARDLDEGLFPAAEVQAIRELVPVAARVLRAAVIRRDTNQAASAPAVLIVAADGLIETTTAEGQALLEEFATGGVTFTTPVLVAARRAKSARNGAPVTLRARGLSGRWFRLHASALGDDGRVAVVIELAPPADLLPILLESYGLTTREAEVVPLLARGFTTKQIAAEMCLSRHTVSDYMKVIFDKCGVASRGELVAKVFTDNVLQAHKSLTGHM